MTRYKPFEIFLILLCVAGMMLTAGCSQNESKEKASWKFQNGQCVGFEYTSSVKGVHVVYFASRGDIEHITPFSSTCVGVMEDFPDDKAIKALAEGVVDAIKGGL